MSIQFLLLLVIGSGIIAQLFLMQKGHEREIELFFTLDQFSLFERNCMRRADFDAVDFALEAVGFYCFCMEAKKQGCCFAKEKSGEKKPFDIMREGNFCIMLSDPEQQETRCLRISLSSKEEKRCGFVCTRFGIQSLELLFRESIRFVMEYDRLLREGQTMLIRSPKEESKWESIRFQARP